MGVGCELLFAQFGPCAISDALRRMADTVNRLPCVSIVNKSANSAQPDLQIHVRAAAVAALAD